MKTESNMDGKSGQGTGAGPAGPKDGKPDTTNAEHGGMPPLSEKALAAKPDGTEAAGPSDNETGKADEPQMGALERYGEGAKDPRPGLSAGPQGGQAEPAGMAKIMGELEKIRTWGNGLADSLNKVIERIEELGQTVEKVSGDVETLGAQTDQMQARLGTVGDGGGISIALFRELEERVNEVADMAKGPMSGPEQKAHLAKQMGKASKAQGESKMMYHKELPPKVAGNTEQAAEFEDMGYKETPLQAAAGDKQLAKQIHERAATD